MGRLLECSPGKVLLDVAGVGYLLQIPLSTYYALCEGRPDKVSLHVHTHVREDALQLYGFASSGEQNAFERLIAISGVGPRLALAILSGIGVRELYQAVLNQDLGRLQKIPGVGKKTAERVLLELRDKLGREKLLEDGSSRSETPSGQDADALLNDGISALVNLGYHREVARGAVAEAIQRTGRPASLEQVLKDALGGLSR